MSIGIPHTSAKILANHHGALLSETEKKTNSLIFLMLFCNHFRNYFHGMSPVVRARTVSDNQLLE